MSADDRVRWEAYPSWNQFAWLFLFGLMAGSRGLRLLRLEEDGWGSWLGGAAGLLICAAGLRRWARYRLTSTHVAMRNGYTGGDIQSIALGDIAEITLTQGPLARFFDIGTLSVRSVSGAPPLILRGIGGPQRIKTHIETARRSAPGP